MTAPRVPDVTGMDTLTAALAYADEGWFVIPVRAQTKNPGSVVGGDWPNLSSRDPQQLAAWFAGTDHGIALHAGRSGAVVLDADDPAARPVEFAAVLSKLDALGAPVQSTSIDGTRRHYLVAMPSGMTVGNGESRMPTGTGGGINVRGLNGVIVVAPTPHTKPTGRYAWLRTGPVPAPDAEVAGWLSPAGEGKAPRASAGAHSALLAAFRPGPACRAVRAAMDRTVWVVNGRHEMALARTSELLNLGVEGHPGAGGALAWLRDGFLAAKQGAEAEWDDQYRRGLDRAVARGAVWHSDPCDQHAPATPLHVPIPPLPSSADVAAHDLGAVIDELKDILDTTERKDRMRGLVAEVALGLLPQERKKWRDAFKDLGLPYGDFDDLLKEVRAQQQAARAAETRMRLEGKGGRELPPPSAPMDVARSLLDVIDSTPSEAGPVHHLGFWRGEFYRWDGARWIAEDEADVRGWLYRETEHGFFQGGTEDEPKTERWLPNPRKVNAVADALGVGVLLRPGAAEHEPCIALTNGVYDLANGQLLPHHPARWNLTALPFAYDPAAACPHWCAFLASVLPPDSIAFLQEWIGYLISGRRDQQKIASLVGRPRSGKGTIARIIGALLGADAVAGPTLGSLTGPFGLEPLLGRALAVFADVKWSARGVGDASELLKTISGEDRTTVHRKNRTAWEGYLPTRFMLMSNDIPSFTDASGALADRLIHVHFVESFLGREDIALTDRLLTELAGILLWAIEGLHRLESRGRFTIPAASAAIDDDVRRTASPHAVFVAERCVVAPDARISLDVLWSAWQSWCMAEGPAPGEKTWFTRKLKAVCPRVTTEEVKSGQTRTKYLVGINLEGPFAPHVLAGPP